jgi:T-complex protein 1 subunit theta
MNKLVINHLGKMFVTSDASTLLRELEVEHPAAKMLVMAADMQHQEVGDFVNFVVTFAGELLSHAESLLRLVRTPVTKPPCRHGLRVARLRSFVSDLIVF